MLRSVLAYVRLRACACVLARAFVGGRSGVGRWKLVRGPSCGWCGGGQGAKAGQELQLVAGDGSQLKEELVRASVNATETQLKFLGSNGVNHSPPRPLPRP